MNPFRKLWFPYAWNGGWWVVAAAMAVFGADGKVALFVLVVGIGLGVLRWTYVLNRVAQINEDTIGALEETVGILENDLAYCRKELGRYRAAFVYARKVGEGVDPKQAAIDAARSVKEAS